MLAFALSMLLAGPAAVPGPVPNTPKKPVTDTYQGVQVTDDYRWLEKLSDPAVTKWEEAQNGRARDYLGKLPHHADIAARMKELIGVIPPQWYGVTERGGKIFALEFQPPKNQPFLVQIGDPADAASAKTILDPNVVDAKGTTAIDFFVPSLDGKYVAVSMSHNGSEEGDVHVLETATGKEVFETVPRVNGGTAGGSLAWNADGTGFFYSRYPRGAERAKEDMGFYTQVYFHKLGTKSETDRYEVGKEFPRIGEILLQTSEDGAFVLARVANGDGGDASFWLRGADGKWTKIAADEDKVYAARFGLDATLWLLSRKDASHGKLLAMPLAHPVLADAKVVVAQDPQLTITAFEPTKTRLYVTDMVGGPSDLRVLDLAGKMLRQVPLLPVSAVNEVARVGGDDVLFSNESYVDPPAWFRIAGADGQPVKTGLAAKPAVDFSDVEVVREMATSKDGTKIPINILRRKGTKLDHSNPTILYAYGGYGVNLTPNYSPTQKLWLEQGGVFAVANLRGGGEFGDEWHLAGNLLNKQNVFDDYAACAQYLIDHGYTSHDKLAFEGGSNGGLLMGAVTTQHPDLPKAVVSFVGVYDMLRVETQPNGAFNVTEYGTVKDPAQFKALYAYSPFHHVKAGTAYPAMLLTTGVHDPRVEPSNSYKMTAALQAATTSKEPILLRVTQSGHGIGMGLDEEIAQATDVYAFYVSELGVDYKPMTKKGS